MEKIKVAIVGLNFGRLIVEELLNPGPAQDFFELVAVCDTDPQRVNAMTAKTRLRGYTSLDALLAESDIPAICLFTGPGGRADLIRKIIHAGKDILTTKPFEVDAQKALEVLREARSLGRIVQMNSPAPLPTGDLRQIGKWHAEYALGRSIGCRAEVWASYREQPDGTWMDDPQKCPAAPIFRLGIYLINDMVHLFGEAEKVSMLSSRIFTKRPTADNAQLGILFKKGVLVNIFASFCINDGQPYANALTLNYENGTIYRGISTASDKEGKRASSLRLVSKPSGGESLTEVTQITDASGEYQWETFHRAIRGEKLEGEISPEQIVAPIKIIAAMMRAEKSGCWESV